MGYLVKATFSAAPEPYSLESIRSGHAQKLLSGNALVREDRQDFWYSVSELVGESPTKEFQFDCPRCQATTSAREIDVGLEAPCRQCGQTVLAPDIQPPDDPSPDLHLLSRGKSLLMWGALIFLGNLALMLSGHGIIIVSWVVELVGICMMINGYGKRYLFYRKHPSFSAASKSARLAALTF